MSRSPKMSRSPVIAPLTHHEMLKTGGLDDNAIVECL